MTAPGPLPRRLILSLGLLAAAWLWVTPVVSAHGFGESYDLPVPLSFFLAGAAAAVAFSFVVIGLFVAPRGAAFGYPTYDLLGAPVLGAVLRSGPLLFAVRAAAALLLLLVAAAGLFGVNKPLENLSPTMVWIIWWIGLGYISALLGNVWALINPWKTLYEWAERLIGGRRSRVGPVLWRYPDRWEVWPAFALFFVFAWLENVYGNAAVPFNLGVLVVSYSLITWAGMIAYGKHIWLGRGEAFAVVFGFFARFSPTEARVAGASVCGDCAAECWVEGEGCVDCYECFELAESSERRLLLRPYAVGLARAERVSTATAVFVVLTLATVTFDGLTETPFWLEVQSAVYPAASTLGAAAVDAIDTAGLTAVPALFILIYGATAWAVRRISGEGTSVAAVARTFVFSLVPIALAYNLAHFISFLLIQGQLIIPLASDPFGFGWDLFGTGDYQVNIRVVNAKLVWYISVAAIVMGHIASVYVAHLISVRTMASHTAALRSQLPMLVPMVAYTVTSLWIIAQPIVTGA